MDIEPFIASVSDADVSDLRERLRRTRWPEAETTAGTWEQGIPLDYVRELCRAWSEDYDFGFADRLNTFEQVRVELTGDGD